MRCVLVLFIFLLGGCMGVGGHGKVYKFIFINGEKESYNFADYHINNVDNKLKSFPHIKQKICIYALSYFIPLNFWDITFSLEQDVKKAIKKAKLNETYFGLANFTSHIEGFASPLFSYGCATISGVPIKNKEDFYKLLQ